MTGLKKNKQALCEYMGKILVFLACTGLAIQAAAGLVHSLPLVCAILLGAASGFVNLLMSLSLIPRFFKRIFGLHAKQSGIMNLSEIWQHCPHHTRFVAGCFAFILAGSLFIYTAIAIIKEASFLAILGYVAALLLGVMMIVQELDTWVASWETRIKVKVALSLQVEKRQAPEEKTEKKQWGQYIGRCIGQFFCMGNVLTLGILFAYGLAVVLPVPVSIGATVGAGIGIALATGVGGGCEYFFYGEFVPKLCGDFGKKLTQYGSMCKKSPIYSTVGTLSVLANAGVNTGVYFSTIMAALKASHLLLIQWGVCHHLWPILALHAISGVLAGMGGMVSFLLGASFLLSAYKTSHSPLGETMSKGETASFAIKSAVQQPAKPPYTALVTGFEQCPVETQNGLEGTFDF